MLRYNDVITHINLAGNYIWPEGAKILSKDLEYNETVTNINLGESNIGYEGVKHLVKALKINNTVDEIDLEYNDIGDQGASILAEFLANNRTIKRLHLNDNNIGEGTLQLFKALEINRTLTEITLGYNIFSREVAKKLLEILNDKNIVSKIMMSFGDNENYDINPNNIDPKLELLIENLKNNYIETDGMTIN